MIHNISSTIDRPKPAEHYLAFVPQLSSEERVSLCTIPTALLTTKVNRASSECKRCSFLPQVLSAFLGDDGIGQEDGSMGDESLVTSARMTLSRMALDNNNSSLHRNHPALVSLLQFRRGTSSIHLCPSLMDDLLVPFLADAFTFLREAKKETSCSSGGHHSLPGPDDLSSSLKRLESRTVEMSLELKDLEVISTTKVDPEAPSPEADQDDPCLIILDGIDEELVAKMDERGQGKVRELQRELMSLRKRMERVFKAMERGREGAARHLLFILIHEIWSRLIASYHLKHGLDQLIDSPTADNGRLSTREALALKEENGSLLARVSRLESDLSVTQEESSALLLDLSSSREALDRAHREIEVLRREAALMASEGRARTRRQELKGALLFSSLPRRDQGLDDPDGDDTPPKDSSHDHGCPVCWTRKKDRVAFNCGHQACSECSERLQLCPLCRVPIAIRIKLF